jgi:hypothetical protein
MLIKTFKLPSYSPMLNFHPMITNWPHLVKWIKWHSSLNSGFMGWFTFCTWLWANHWLNLWAVCRFWYMVCNCKGIIHQSHHVHIYIHLLRWDLKVYITKWPLVHVCCPLFVKRTI